MRTRSCYENIAPIVEDKAKYRAEQCQIKREKKVAMGKRKNRPMEDRKEKLKELLLNKSPSKRIAEMQMAVCTVSDAIKRIQSIIRKDGWPISDNISQVRDSRDKMTGCLTDIRQGWNQLDKLDFFRLIGATDNAKEIIVFTNKITHESHAKIDDSKLQAGVNSILSIHSWWAEIGRTQIVPDVQASDFTWFRIGDVTIPIGTFELIEDEPYHFRPTVLIALTEDKTHHALIMEDWKPTTDRQCYNKDLVDGPIQENIHPSNWTMEFGGHISKRDDESKEFVRYVTIPFHQRPITLIGR